MPPLARVPIISLSALASIASPGAASSSRDACWETVSVDASMVEGSAEGLEWHTLQVCDEAGAEWKVRDDIMVRSWRGAAVELPSTDRRGTGAIHDIALDRHGRLLIAAERGLFLADRRSDWIDPVPGWCGASPTSVHVDPRGCVWVGTGTGLWVLDPVEFYGRSFGDQDLPPGGGPLLVVGDSVDVFVQRGRGLWRHRPSEEEPCFLDPPFQLVAPGSGPLLFVPRARAAGGATYWHRLDGHHVWKPLRPGRVDTAPGQHVLEVMALDHCLRRSDIHTVRFEMPMPFRYRKDVLLAFGAGTTGLLFLGFLVVQRDRRRAMVSVILTVGVGLQVLAACLPHARAWPFIGFTMYTDTAEENQVVHDVGLAGLRSGSWDRLPGPRLGVALDSRWQLIRPLVRGGDEAAREYIERWNEMRPHPIEGLQVRSWRRRLLREGPVEIAPLVLLEYRLPLGEGR